MYMKETCDDEQIEILDENRNLRVPVGIEPRAPN